MTHVPIATELSNAERVNISNDLYLHMLYFVAVVVVVIRRTVTQSVLTATLILPAVSTFCPVWLLVHESLNENRFYAENICFAIMIINVSFKPYKFEQKLSLLCFPLLKCE